MTSSQSLLEMIFSWSSLFAFLEFLPVVVTAVATVLLWKVTKVLATETRKLASMKPRPFVVGTFSSSSASSAALNFSLLNTGDATAFDVVLSVSPSIREPNGAEPKEGSADRIYVNILAPRREVVTKVAFATEIPTQVYKVSVSWLEKPKGTDRQMISYETQASDGFGAAWGENGLHQIHKEVEGIRLSAQKIAKKLTG